MIDQKTKVLIVEDEVAIAEDLKDILELEDYIVLPLAFSYDQAIAELAKQEVDLVILDIALQGRESGLNVADVLNSKYQIPFIFLTSFSDHETIGEVIKRNPGGYLVKPFKEKDIIPALLVALANDRTKKKEVFPKLEFLNNKLAKGISPQEYKVLKLLWLGKKNSQIADDLYVSINTIKTHITKIYSKLGVNSRTSAINQIMKP